MILVLLLITMNAFSQGSGLNYDSLFSVIKTTDNIAEKQYAYALYANKFVRSNIDSAEIFVRLASPTLQSDNYQAISEYYSVLGLLKWQMKDMDSALINYKKAYQLSLINKFDKINANAAGYIGMFFKINGSFDSATYYLEKSISICERINNTNIVNKAHYDLAGVYSQLGKHELSLTHYFAALKLQEAANDSIRIIYTYNGLGNAYKFLKKGEKSKSFYFKSIQLDKLITKIDQRVNNYTNIGLLYESFYKNIDSALFYYFSAMDLLPENDNSWSKALLVVNIGNSYYALRDFRKALHYYNESLQFDFRKMNPYLYSAILINKSIVYFELNKYDSTYTLGRRGLELAESIEALDWQINAHSALFKVDSATGQFNSAIKHLRKMYSLTDTVYSKDNRNRVSELEVIYETEKKDALNKSLIENNALDQKMIKNQRHIILSSFIAFVLFILLIFSILRSTKKQKHINNKLNLVNVEIIEKNKEIDEKNQLLIEQNQQLIKLNDTKDKFFSIISHDLRGPFNALLGYLELLNTEYESLTESEKKNMLKAVHKSSTNSYNLLVNLLDWARTQRGLLENNAEELDMYEVIESTIEIVRQRADKKSQRLINVIDPKTFVFADLNLLSSVVLNLLNNAIKFSPGGSLIKISAELTKESVMVHVQDQGMGIPKEDQKDLFTIGNSAKRQGTDNELGTGIGLVLVREFVQLIGGRVSVSSEEGKGSVFSFTVPLKKPENSK